MNDVIKLEVEVAEVTIKRVKKNKLDTKSKIETTSSGISNLEINDHLKPLTEFLSNSILS